MGLLRLLLATSVFVAHTQPLFGLPFIGGQVAVQSFYVLSGFYMALILHEKYTGRRARVVFWRSRLLRIFPSYIVISLLALVAVFLFHADPYDSWAHAGHITPLTLLTLIGTQITILGMDVLLFLGYDTQTGSLAPHGDVTTSSFFLLQTAWTLGVEMWFYLLAPFVVRRRLRVVATFILASIALRLLFAFAGFSGGVWVYRFFPFELVFFLLGVMTYRLYAFLHFRTIHALWKVPAWLFAFTITTTLGLFVEDGWIRLFVYLGILTPLLPLLFAITKQSKIDRLLGDLAYPVYLSHFLFMELNRRLLFADSNIDILLATLLFSLLLVLFVESPLYELRQHLARATGRVQHVSLRLLLAVVFVGASIILLYFWKISPPVTNEDLMAERFLEWSETISDPSVPAVVFQDMSISHEDVRHILLDRSAENADTRAKLLSVLMLQEWARTHPAE